MELDGPGISALTEIDGVSLDERVGYCRRFWPDQMDTQGFFVAKVVKL
jgi:16S rRNA C967 or C1407 C5-methylase (RsmB/RsmF family)